MYSWILDQSLAAYLSNMLFDLYTSSPVPQHGTEETGQLANEVRTRKSLDDDRDVGDASTLAHIVTCRVVSVDDGSP